MTTTLKHFNPNSIRARTKMLYCLAISPAMQAIVVDCVPIVDPQLAAII